MTKWVVGLQLQHGSSVSSVTYAQVHGQDDVLIEIGNTMHKFIVLIVVVVAVQAARYVPKWKKQVSR